MIDQTPISELVQSVDIVEYVSQFMDLELRQDGEYWGVSCLSDHDSDPSFSVNPEKQVFWDFSSHSGGNVLNFIMRYNNCSLPHAVDILKSYLSEKGIRPDDVKSLNCTREIMRYSVSQKKEKEAKYKNLGNSYMDRYAEDWSKTSVWEDEGITREAMRLFQVRYDPVSERIVFPIRSMNGSIINVCGRTIDPDFKAKKLRKYTYFFPLGRFDTLYGYAENSANIREKREIIVFEGPKSVMKAWGWGVDNAVALCTSHLNTYQFDMFLRIGVRTVFALDSDASIFSDENIIRLTRYLNVENVVNRDGLLGEKMAPVDAGEDVWRKLYAKRRKVVRKNTR